MKFWAHCNSVRSLISKAKSSFLSNLVTESSANPRTLWKTFNTILHRNPSSSLPKSPDASSLANTFLDFSKDKIERICKKFLPSDFPDPFLLFFLEESDVFKINLDDDDFKMRCYLCCLFQAWLEDHHRKFGHFIDNAWVNPDGRKTYETKCPATGSHHLIFWHFIINFHSLSFLHLVHGPVLTTRIKKYCQCVYCFKLGTH